MFTWNQLQTENGIWASRNFGTDRKAIWPLWGLLEELGELTHARLKREQGIRGTVEEHLAAERDAVADSIIFFADVCNTQGWQMEAIARTPTLGAFQETFRIPVGDDPIIHMSQHLGMALLHVQERNKMILAGVEGAARRSNTDAQHEMFCYLSGLSMYCHQQEWALSALVEETWKKVRQRDWTKNKTNGEALVVEAVTEVRATTDKVEMTLQKPSSVEAEVAPATVETERTRAGKKTKS